MAELNNELKIMQNQVQNCQTSKDKQQTDSKRRELYGNNADGKLYTWYFIAWKKQCVILGEIQKNGAAFFEIVHKHWGDFAQLCPNQFHPCPVPPLCDLRNWDMPKI